MATSKHIYRLDYAFIAHGVNIDWFLFYLCTNLFALYKASSTGKSDDLVILSEWFMLGFVCVFVSSAKKHTIST